MAPRRVLLAVLLLTACHQVTDYPKQPAMTQRATDTTTILTVHFVRDVDEILKACPQLTGGTYYGCAKQGHGVCDIYLQEPTDFNDVPRLATFGHEAWHCFGARHQ